MPMLRSAVFALLILPASVTLAQVETSSSIRGLVSDPSGAAVVGAQIRITDVDTGETRATVTDESVIIRNGGRPLHKPLSEPQPSHQLAFPYQD